MAAATKIKRRKLRFQSLDDVLADARMLARTPHRQLGNWNLGQALEHLSRVFEMSLDGFNVQVPWLLSAMGRLLRPIVLRVPMPPGVKLPPEAAKVMVPSADQDTTAALQRFEGLIHRLKTETQRAPSPVFGPMNVEQWNLAHQRHAELHLSFFVPEQDA